MDMARKVPPGQGRSSCKPPRKTASFGIGRCWLATAATRPCFLWVLAHVPKSWLRCSDARPILSRSPDARTTAHPYTTESELCAVSRRDHGPCERARPRACAGRDQRPLAGVLWPSRKRAGKPVAMGARRACPYSCHQPGAFRSLGWWRACRQRLELRPFASSRTSAPCSVTSRPNCASAHHSTRASTIHNTAAGVWARTWRTICASPFIKKPFRPSSRSKLRGVS